MTRQRMLALLTGPELACRLPEIAALQGVRQPPEYHGEGDALAHTRLAVAALAEDAEARLIWATALHDVGKAQTTRLSDGRWRALGHDRVSSELVGGILARFDQSELQEDVAWLVRHHHFSSSWQPQEPVRLTARQRRFCRHRLFPLLVALCRADAAASYGVSDKLQRLELILSVIEEANDGSPPV